MPEAAYKDIFEQDEITYRLPILRSEINIMRRDIDALKDGITELKQDAKSIKSTVAELRNDNRILQNDVSALKSDVRDIHSEISNLKTDVRTIGARLDSVDRRIDDLHQSHTKWFALLGLLITAIPIAIAVIQHIIGK